MMEKIRIKIRVYFSSLGFLVVTGFGYIIDARIKSKSRYPIKLKKKFSFPEKVSQNGKRRTATRCIQPVLAVG